MAIGTTTALVLGGSALAGGIAGAMGSKSSQQSTSGVRLGAANGLENLGFGLSQGSLEQLRSLMGQGPTGQDYSAGIGATRDVASLLQQMQASGGTPNADQLSTARSFANDIFGAQRLVLDQSFEDQMRKARQDAAMAGRDLNDPVLRGMMMQNQMRQQSMLNAEQNSFATNFALNLPQQQLQFASQRADVLNALGNQALQNQNALFGLGQQAMLNERNFRLSTAEQWGNSTAKSGGGLQGAITGGIGGASAGLGMMNGLKQLGIGGGGGGLQLPQMQMPMMGQSAGFGGGGGFNLLGGANLMNSPMFPSASSMGGSFGGASPFGMGAMNAEMQFHGMPRTYSLGVR